VRRRRVLQQACSKSDRLLGLIFYDSVGEWIALVGLAVAFGGYLVILNPHAVAKHDALSHPEIQDLKVKGWELGSKPPKN
jgi:hypothetical protein